MANPIPEATWRLLVQRIHEQECVPFLGAGASLGFDNQKGLPTARELALRLAAACGFPEEHASDLLRVAQYFELANDPDALRKFVRKQLTVDGVQPSAVHRTLARLPFHYYLTTNFDKLLERALEDRGRAPKTGAYVRRADVASLGPGTIDEPVVYKLHGSFDRIESMVLTEEDIVDFAACLMLANPPLPEVLRSIFTDCSLLFIGYGLKDWNVRVMLRALRRDSRGKNSWAIQRRPSSAPWDVEWDNAVMLLDRKESLRCFDMDAVAFVTELGQRYDAAHP